MNSEDYGPIGHANRSILWMVGIICVMLLSLGALAFWLAKAFPKLPLE